MAEHKTKGGGGGNYIRFMAMIGTSTVVMFILIT